MKTAEILHTKFNLRSHRAPVRLKGFNRISLAQLFAELNFKRGAEIGVADGQNSLVLCQNIPDLVLYCIDPYTVYKGNPYAHNNQDEMFNKAQERLSEYDVTFIGQHSLEAVRQFGAGDLDFVYIDGNHTFDYVMTDIIGWSQIVRPGGIVSGHDYYHFRHAGVVDAVDAFTRAHDIREWFIDGEREPSYFWVNP